MKHAQTTETEIVHCADCALLIPPPLPHATGTGYAILPDERKICYACADNRQREELKDRKPFVAYVAGHGKTITTWTGGVLALITRSTTCRLTRQSFIHGKTIQCIHARDIHGGHWTGRGNPGLAIKLRPVKAK